MTDLDRFFAKRTLGFEDNHWSATGWYWRGQGYDEGWDDVNPDDLRELWMLLTAYLAPDV